MNFLRKRLFDSPRAAGGGAEGASKDAGAEGKGEGKGAEASKGKGGEGAGAGGGSVFCYVNSVFAPGLDEGVGALWRVSVYFPPFVFGVRSFFLVTVWPGEGRRGLDKTADGEIQVLQDRRPTNRCVLDDAGFWMRCALLYGDFTRRRYRSQDASNVQRGWHN